MASGARDEEEEEEARRSVVVHGFAGYFTSTLYEGIVIDSRLPSR